jgi:stage II sporulation protein D
VRVTTEAGPVLLAGLEIRFALGLPETLFTVVAGKEAGGSPVFTFYGRGWGHGVGLCQNGAFGMALAGKSAAEILSRYYPGTALVPFGTLSSAPPAPAVR